MLKKETIAFHKKGKLCLRHRKPNADMALINTVDPMQTNASRDI